MLEPNDLPKAKSAGKPDVVLAYAANGAYAPPLCAAIESVLETGDPERVYRIFVLHDGLAADIVGTLEGLGGERTPVRCVSVGRLTDNAALYSTSYLTREMYFRLFIPDVLPGFDKVLYLDCDTIALADVGELFDTPLRGAVIGGIIDLYETRELDRLRRVLSYAPARYFNSGVLLMDCRKFETERILEQCLAFLQEHDRLVCPDQDALNIVCEKKVRFLDGRWNVFWESSEVELADISILHYTSDKKPWNSLRFPRAEYFWRCAEKTPYFDLLASGVLYRQADVVLHSGVEETALRRFRDGDMGMRSILRFVRAWLGYKLRKKAVGL